MASLQVFRVDLILSLSLFSVDNKLATAKAAASNLSLCLGSKDFPEEDCSKDEEAGDEKEVVCKDCRQEDVIYTFVVVMGVDQKVNAAVKLEEEQKKA